MHITQHFSCKHVFIIGMETVWINPGSGAQWFIKHFICDKCCFYLVFHFMEQYLKLEIGIYLDELPDNNGAPVFISSLS